MSISVVGLLATSVAGQAKPPSTRTIETVDNALCGFPLKIIVSDAQKVHELGTTGVRLTGQSKVTLLNLASGQEATLNNSGSFAFYPETGTLSFVGHVLWMGGPNVPYLSTSGKGSLNSFFVLSSTNDNAKVIDPCTLVGPPASVTPVTTPPPWGLPSDVLSHIGFAGLTPLIGNLIRHDHDHLDVIVNGRPVTVPAGVGQAEPIETGPCPPEESFGGDCATGNLDYAGVAYSPLHTHSTSGIIHIETDRPGTFTLGEFFDEWGVRLTQTCVGGYCTGGSNELRVYVNGNRVAGNPREIALSEHQEIAVVYGGPGAFSSVPSSYNDWPDPEGGCGGIGEPSCVP